MDSPLTDGSSCLLPRHPFQQLMKDNEGGPGHLSWCTLSPGGNECVFGKVDSPFLSRLIKLHSVTIGRKPYGGKSMCWELNRLGG